MKKWLIGFLTGFFLLSSVQVLAVNQKEPQTMVIELSQIGLDALNKDAERLAKDPAALRQFAEKNVLPYVDMARMARYVAGPHWRGANKNQQAEFVEQFTLTLMRSYSQSLLKLEIAKMDVGSAIPDGKERVIVPSKVTQKSGAVADISYRVFKESQSGNWYVYDVVVEGISLLLNFRQSYTTDIERRGFDQVVLSMKEANKSFQ
jgi:phospholipid transport system substrate-binding protein